MSKQHPIVFDTEIRGKLPDEFLFYFAKTKNVIGAAARAVNVKYREIKVLPSQKEIWVEQHQQLNVSSRFSVFNTSTGFGLQVQCQGHGIFRVSQEEIEIDWLPGGTGAAHYFFAYCLPLWLEYLGIPVFHASAVGLSRGSVAFLGRSGVGKSTMAANLCQLGCHFLADDGLPVVELQDGSWQCVTGPPVLKLWPESIEQLHTTPADRCPRVHKSFEKRLIRSRSRSMQKSVNLKLIAIYLLERSAEQSGPVETLSAGNAEVPIRLIENSLAAGPASALGLSARRFMQLTRMARSVPVRVLRFPGTFNNAQQVLNAITEDLNMPQTNMEINAAER